MTRTLGLVVMWIAGIVVFLSAAAFAVLGRDFLRPLLRLRARAATGIETALQPPSQAEIAAARATDTASAQLTGRTDAAPLGFIIAFVGAILLAAFVAFYLTGRRRRASR